GTLPFSVSTFGSMRTTSSTKTGGPITSRRFGTSLIGTPSPSGTPQRSNTASQPSRRKAGERARKERRLPHIRKSHQLHHHPLESHAEAAVRRHRPTKRIEVALKRSRIHAPFAESFPVGFITVQPLPAR